MSTACVSNVTCRPAWPDESGRANFIEARQSWPFPRSNWFLAVTDDPLERIVGAIRHHRTPATVQTPAVVDFRFTPGPGREIHGTEERFLSDFIAYLESKPHAMLRYCRLLESGDSLEAVLQNLGFYPRYRESWLEAPWLTARERLFRSLTALKRRPSSLQAAAIVPLSDVSPEQAIPLLTHFHLMTEAEIRSLWNSSNPGHLDRSISACVVLAGEVVGVLLCAVSGKKMRILALAGREDIPGAQSYAMTRLMEHVFVTCADREFEHLQFRANSDMARQTTHLALRSGGVIVRELRRWVKD